ncbi:MAG: MFS transporter [Muribaculaceae bacterium]|nr:MFS transporter [Muribaculaceae bacterium]
MVKTGKAPITLMTYLAIMSISLIVNLPGLAVAPMEGKLKEILHAPELEVQLLTTLPNFLIIPFVLLSGKLSEAKHKIPIIVGALILYCGCAIWYLFAGDMNSLIIISCLLGCAAGLLIPFSTGLIADTFAGKYRMKQMGWQSGISNSTVVIATFVVGWLITGRNWHLPFIVYLAAGIPLIFSIGLKNVPGIYATAKQDEKLEEQQAEKAITQATENTSVQTQTAVTSQPQTSSPIKQQTGSPTSCNATQDEVDQLTEKAQQLTEDADKLIPTTAQITDKTTQIPVVQEETVDGGFNVGRIWGLIAVYFFVTFTSIAITNYCSQLTQQLGWSSGIAGIVTAIFFLFVLIPGYILPWFIKRLKADTFFWTALMMLIGLGLFVFVRQEWAMYVGAAFTGLGYGICQPMLYDKASYTVTNPAKVTLALAFVLTANYLAIAVQPFVISGISKLFHVRDENTFAFSLSFVLVIAYTLITFLFRKKFAFTVDKSYY